MSLVPNQPPTVADSSGRRLAVIGESPGLEEENWCRCPRGHEYSRKKWEFGSMVDVLTCPVCSSPEFTRKPTPFIGPSGYLLTDCLQRAGIRREYCFVGNVSRERLSEHEFCAARCGSHLDALADELAAFKPNCVLLLGNQALRAFHPWHWTTTAAYEADHEDPRQLQLFNDREVPRRPRKSSKGTDYVAKIGDWRGSIFESDEMGTTGLKWKCVAAYHPAAVLRQRDWMPIIRQDIKRAVGESRDPALNLPQRRLVTPGDADALVGYLDTLRAARMPLGFDLEGYAASGITVCSFSRDPAEAYVVPLRHLDGTPWWAPTDEHRVLAAFRALLEDPAVPKVGHNILYELFVMRWHYGIKIHGITGDTMLKWAELFAELDKALEVPASVLTRQPYWKYGRKAQTDEELIAYNAIDTCVTLELDREMEPLLAAGQRKHYAFNLSLLEPMSEMMFRGIRFDTVARDALIRKCNAEVLGLQGRLDRLARIAKPTLEEVAEIVCYAKKRGLVQDWPDVAVCAKPLWQENL